MEHLGVFAENDAPTQDGVFRRPGHGWFVRHLGAIQGPYRHFDDAAEAPQLEPERFCNWAALSMYVGKLLLGAAALLVAYWVIIVVSTAMLNAGLF